MMIFSFDHFFLHKLGTSNVPEESPFYDDFTHLSTINISPGLVYIITSPNYPFEYPNLITAAWIITAPTAMKIRLEIKEFLLERNYDFITVGNGNILGADLLWRQSGTTYLSVIFSLSESMWIVMTSDGSFAWTGFAFYLKSYFGFGK